MLAALAGWLQSLEQPRRKVMGWIERGDWLQFAERARLNPKLVLTALTDLAMRLPQLAQDTAAGMQLDDAEQRGFLERIIAVIDEHARFAQDVVTNG